MHLPDILESVQKSIELTGDAGALRLPSSYANARCSVRVGQERDIALWAGVRKIEEMHQITDGRSVDRHIRITCVDSWVGQIIKAARRKRRESPVALDKLKN